MTLAPESHALNGAGEDATPRRPALPTSALICVSAVVGAALLSVLVGARDLPWSALLDGDHPLHPIYETRIDRTLLALAVGGALALAGAVMQGLTRNPLADPGILGVNAGATFAMVVGMSVLGFSSLEQFLPMAFLGAALAALVVHLIASLGRDGASPMKLAITGAALTAGLTSWTTGMLLLDQRTMESFRYWQVGTVGGRPIDLLLTAAPFLATGAVLALIGARTLDTLALGDDLARGLGRRTALDRVVLSLSIVLLAGSATAIAGPIAFVGLVVPHAVRAFVGPHHARLLPFSIVAGAALVTAADTLGRVVLPPAEVQVGIMAAAVGVPFFLALVRRTGRGL